MLRNGLGIDAALAYVRHGLSYERTVASLGNIGLSAATTLAGVHIQQAVRCLSEADTLLDQAEDVLEVSVSAPEQGFDLRAITLLAQLPIYRAHIGNPKFPETKVIKQAQDLMLEGAGIAVNHAASNRQQPGRAEHLKDQQLAQDAVLMLLRRFAMTNELTNDFSPVSSYLAENLSPAPHTPSWDISVYIPNRKERPTLGYKIQVEPRSQIAQRVPKGNALVTVATLTAGDESSANSAQIIKELRQIEQNPFPPETVIEKVNGRTEKLLKILDRSERKIFLEAD